VTTPVIDFYAEHVDWYALWIAIDIRQFVEGRRRSMSGRP